MALRTRENNIRPKTHQDNNAYIKRWDGNARITTHWDGLHKVSNNPLIGLPITSIGRGNKQEMFSASVALSLFKYSKMETKLLNFI